jgi:chromosome segregation protein
LEARPHDIAETPGSRFLQRDDRRAVGLLKDLVRADDGLERALVAALGPLADAVVYEDLEVAIVDARDGDGAIFAIAGGGPVRQGLVGERSLLSVVDAEPVARGIVSTLLRDVYLVDGIDEAADKQAEHPACSFVTPDGVLVGPAVIHTAREADARSREIRAELRVLDHDLAATHQAIKPRRARLEEIAGESAFLGEQIDAADADITAAAERLARSGAEVAALTREHELLGQRATALDEQADLARARLAEMEPDGEPMPELPPTPQPPIQGLRVHQAQGDGGQSTGLGNP